MSYCLTSSLRNSQTTHESDIVRTVERLISALHTASWFVVRRHSLTFPVVPLPVRYQIRWMTPWHSSKFPECPAIFSIEVSSIIHVFTMTLSVAVSALSLESAEYSASYINTFLSLLLQCDKLYKITAFGR